MASSANADSRPASTTRTYLRGFQDVKLLLLAILGDDPPVSGDSFAKCRSLKSPSRRTYPSVAGHRKYIYPQQLHDRRELSHIVV